MFYNYRPISILPVISKIYGKISYEQLILTVFICIALIIITYISEKNPCLEQFWPQGIYLSVVYDRESLRSKQRGSGRDFLRLSQSHRALCST